jgi:DNA mismatch repair protein MutS
VLARATQVLTALEARARGLDPLSDELPLFARPATASPPVAISEHPALAALAALDPDSLSPREAHEAIYRLRTLVDGAVNRA